MRAKLACLVYQSATRLAQLVRTREVSAREVVEAHLRRIEAVEALNAVVTLVAPEVALEEARRLDDAPRERLPPLAGVPMTIKDSFDTEGVVSAAGTLGRKSFVPKEDATVVARLKAAGAILIAKTATPELTLSLETESLVHGRTSNPWSLDRTSGGSSGGAAALVSAGGTPFDVGTDYGGSIRVPAHSCGTCGLKPTHGRVPRTGHILDDLAGATESFQTAGPIARTVEDLELLLPIIAGPDGRDPHIHPVPLETCDDSIFENLRVAWHVEALARPVDAVCRAVEAAVDVLEAPVVHERKPTVDWDRVQPIWRGLAGADGGKVFADKLLDVGTSRISPAIQWTTTLPSDDTVTDLLQELGRFRRRMLDFMKDYDVIICPVSGDVACLHGTSRDNLAETFAYNYAYNLSGHPSVVVPFYFPEATSMPVGVQVIANRWRDDVALRVARRIEERHPCAGWRPPPLFFFDAP
ncbi:hypothetical protein CTAYLR_003348 [Chrysophaeum taylorii]|uniref:Amidase domain-containing protein n=1 Tax=Chrysophaeum taylorii TaxID=2483200 RepID=A0AAD7XPR1_9STRA|nr:hypothetical protein CTAYLR_003348 [Chrysophaeum taylorii]